MIARRRSADKEGGSALVELALLIPLFGVMLVSAAEFGRLAYADIEVSNAARAGVAYGSQNHATASDTSGMQTAATQDAPDVTSISAIATSFCNCSDGTAITCANPLKCVSPAAHVIEYVKVNTTAAVTTAFHYPGMPTSYTLNGQAIMRVER
jgi:Flp pilus assembly protein TadG